MLCQGTGTTYIRSDFLGRKINYGFGSYSLPPDRALKLGLAASDLPRHFGVPLLVAKPGHAACLRLMNRLQGISYFVRPLRGRLCREF